jgi:homopolymeric O-antigen transport system permease protein
MSITSNSSASTLKPASATENIPEALRHPTSESLPDEPLITIQPSGSWSRLNLRDLWTYRELLYFLTWRDLKVRYKQTIFGVTWVIIPPLLITFIFTIFLGMLARVPSDPGVPYVLFVYVGILPWTFFTGAVTVSGASLVSNANLITKVYFPRLIAPVSAVGGRLIDLAIALLILSGMMLYFRVGVTWKLLMVPALVLLLTLLALGCGMLIAALNVRYRDAGLALPVIIQAWMYVSPILYPSRLVPDKWRWFYDLNPLVGIIDNFRASLFGSAFNWYALGVSVTFSLLLLVYSAYIFRRAEKSFADVI